MNRNLASQIALLTSALTPFCVSAWAGAGTESAPSKSGYHLFNPTPAAQMRELTTDRPDKTESPITVDAGHFQIETDILTLAWDRSTAVAAGTNQATDTRTRFYTLNLMNLKAGLTSWMDLQTVVETYKISTTQEGGAAETSKSGFGDLTFRLKLNFLGNDGGAGAVGIMPFIKLPTNQNSLGNSKVEGGIILPVALDLPSEFGLGFMLQWNRFKNEGNDLFHNDMISSMTLGHPILGGLAGYAEIFNQTGDDSDSMWICTADFGLTWGITSQIQLDAGLNIGVTAAAPDWNPFVGISARL